MRNFASELQRHANHRRPAGGQRQQKIPTQAGSEEGAWSCQYSGVMGAFRKMWHGIFDSLLPRLPLSSLLLIGDSLLPRLPLSSLLLIGGDDLSGILERFRAVMDRY